MATRYRVIGTKILVRRFKTTKTTKTGFTLPESMIRPATRGEVVAHGEGKLLNNGTLIPLKVKIGDILTFTEYAGQLLEESGDRTAAESDLIVLGDEDEFLAIVEES